MSDSIFKKMGSVVSTAISEIQTTVENNAAVVTDLNTEILKAKDFKIQNIGSVAVNTNLNCSQYNYFVIEPTANITLSLTNVVAGTGCIVQLLGAGDHTITWSGGNFIWDKGTAPILTKGNLNSIVSFLTNDGISIRGKLIFTEV